MREVQVLTWCDNCRINKDLRTPAETTNTITIGRAKPRTLDLCAPCIEELLTPLLALLDEAGSVEDSPATPRKQVSAAGRQNLDLLAKTRRGRPPSGPTMDCLWCDLSYSLNTSGGFQRHLRVAHGFAGYKEAFGGLCPVCGEGPWELMFAHVQKSHPDLGFEGVAQPFIWARDHGDPHGVYAAKLAQKGSLDPDKEWERTREIERGEQANREAGSENARPRAAKKSARKTA